MPSFAGLPEQKKKDLVNFLASLRGDEESSGTNEEPGKQGSTDQGS